MTEPCWAVSTMKKLGYLVVDGKGGEVRISMKEEKRRRREKENRGRGEIEAEY
jgi:hypothetical protein